MVLTRHFKNAINTNANYQTALQILQKNIRGGNIWVIGGTVFRNIAKNLFGEIKVDDKYDLDFIMERPPSHKNILIPNGWKAIKTGLGGTRLIEGKKQIDIVPLNDAILPKDKFQINKMSTDEKIQSYLKRVMLDVQSIVYDVNRDQILGKAGAKSIRNKIVKVNNIEECISFCKRRRISIHNLIKSKANSLRFSPKYYSFNKDTDKNLTIDYYDNFANEYEERQGYITYLNNYLKKEAKYFLKFLPGHRILDLGSGPGRDALYFKSEGYKLTCVDLSSTMAAICTNRTLKALQMDIENLEFEDDSFDGIWANASLLHIPKKRIYNSLARIKEVLKKDGVFFLSMIEGDAEKLSLSRSVPEQKRFFASYQQNDLVAIIEEYFDILHSSRTEPAPGQIFLNYICTPNDFIYKG